MKKVIIKRFIAIMSVIIFSSGISFFSYIKGHYDGTTIAEIRSLNYETFIWNSNEADERQQVRRKLFGLMRSRYNWVNSSVTPLESWSYWSSFDVHMFRKTTHQNAQIILDDPKNADIRFDIDEGPSNRHK